MRMAGIVRSLLEFSRGGGYDGPRDTRLTALIDDAVRSFESPASEAGISIICDYDAGDAPIHRPDNLFQVFCNLIKNAIDAMPDGGRLMIRTRTGDSAGEIRFEDTGVGLPEDTSKLFEPFFTTKSNGNGTGLGLAVCREIVEKYGGRIEAESRSGGGAAFVIHLPLATAAAGVGRTTDARIVVGDELTETSRDD
jgi:signal transduction histidine kinase